MIITSFLLPTSFSIFRHPAMLLSVGLSALSLFNGYGTFLEWDILGLNLILYQSDSLTLPFAIIFHIAAILVIILAGTVKFNGAHMATLTMQALLLALHTGIF